MLNLPRLIHTSFSTGDHLDRREKMFIMVTRFPLFLVKHWVRNKSLVDYLGNWQK